MKKKKLMIILKLYILKKLWDRLTDSFQPPPNLETNKKTLEYWNTLGPTTHRLRSTEWSPSRAGSQIKVCIDSQRIKHLHLFKDHSKSPHLRAAKTNQTALVVALRGTTHDSSLQKTWITSKNKVKLLDCD